MMTTTLGVAFVFVYLAYGMIVSPKIWFAGSWAIWMFCTSGLVKWMSEGGNLGPGFTYAFLQGAFASFIILAYVSHKYIENLLVRTVLSITFCGLAAYVLQTYQEFGMRAFGIPMAGMWPKEHYSRGSLRDS